MSRMSTTIATGITARFGSLELEGDIAFDQRTQTLFFEYPMEPSERISTNLDAYGYLPELGCVFIKDWSEHEGLAQSLVDAGVAEVVRELVVGPFASTAYEVRLLAAIEAPVPAMAA